VTPTRIGYAAVAGNKVPAPTVRVSYTPVLYATTNDLRSTAPRPAPPLLSDVKEQICPISKLEISPEPVVPGRKVRVKSECTATEVTTNGKM